MAPLVTRDVEEASRLMLAYRGRVVAYPTETVYGLGALIGDPLAVGRILDIKGRDAAKGMIVLISGLAMASEVALLEEWQVEVLKRLWPAAVSVVLTARKGLNPFVAPNGKIALRDSADPYAKRLVELVGPITSTSANRSGREAAQSARDVLAQDLEVDAIIDGGHRPAGMPSTLVDFTKRPVVCLREGAVPFERVASLLVEGGPSSPLR